jgi:hypothetical protein
MRLAVVRMYRADAVRLPWLLQGKPQSLLDLPAGSALIPAAGPDVSG